MPTASGARQATSDIIKAVATPQRRQLLRILHGAGEARSPNELAKELGTNVSKVSYHFKTLTKCGALEMTDRRQVRGAVEHFYASTLMDDQMVATLLAATRDEDEKAVRKAKKVARSA
jgi:DNA-binding transcriptional ArsR family regulator